MYGILKTEKKFSKMNESIENNYKLLQIRAISLFKNRL